MSKELQKIASSIIRAASIIAMDSKREPKRHTILQRAEEIVKLAELLKKGLEKNNENQS
jgi:hypothetical protein